MRLVVYTNSTYEDERALVNLDTNTVLTMGDSYHHKICDRIEGFIEALKYCNVAHTILEGRKITPDDEEFDVYGFYDNRD